jgi:fumarate hydratase class II
MLEQLKHLDHSLPHLAELALGGTAVGTGLNTHPECRYASRPSWRRSAAAVCHRAEQV